MNGYARPWAVALAFAAAVAGAAETDIPSKTVQLQDPMNVMLRADRDKDGTVTQEELEVYDVTLARRFRDADADRDGKLTLQELERIIAAPGASASRR